MLPRSSTARDARDPRGQLQRDLALVAVRKRPAERALQRADRGREIAALGPSAQAKPSPCSTTPRGTTQLRASRSASPVKRRAPRSRRPRARLAAAASDRATRRGRQSDRARERCLSRRSALRLEDQIGRGCGRRARRGSCRERAGACAELEDRRRRDPAQSPRNVRASARPKQTAELGRGHEIAARPELRATGAVVAEPRRIEAPAPCSARSRANRPPRGSLRGSARLSSTLTSSAAGIGGGR